MIYIDPPYNAGNDIIYKNSYKDSIDYYLKVTWQLSTQRERERESAMDLN
jgi:adenine-specific DNA-methyltransferase